MMTSARRGFTLLETVLYIALATIILYAAAQLYTVIVTTQAKNRAMADVTLAAEDALLRITQTVRDAESVSEPASGQTGDMLTLEMRESAEFETEEFVLENGVIYMQDGSQPRVAITPVNVYVSDLQVADLSVTGQHSLQISFTATSNATDRTELGYTDTFYATATIR
jgi:type II secretory pathway pseudopilin PulG